MLYKQGSNRRQKQPIKPRKRLANCAIIGLSSLIIAAALPSYAHAQEQYKLINGQWEKLATYPPNSPEGKLQTIRKKIAEEQYREAEDLAKSWIAQYPDSPMLVEAYLLSGDAKTGRKYYYEALYDYEKVIRDFPASEQFHTALEREYQIGRLYLKGIKRRLFSMPIIPADSEGEELLIRIQERAPGSALGEKASLFLADHLYDIGDMEDAAEAYDLFLTNYPFSSQREWAMLRLIHASLARFKGPQYDPSGLIEAQTRLEVFREEFPASAERIGANSLIVRIQESLALKHLSSAEWYITRGNEISAAYTLRRIIEDFPQTTAARQALKRLTKLNVPDKIKLQRVGQTLPEVEEIEQAPSLREPINRETKPNDVSERDTAIYEREQLERGQDPQTDETGDFTPTPDPEFRNSDTETEFLQEQ